MNDRIEATVFVVWDETGLHAAHVDAVAGPIVMELGVPETSDVSSSEVCRG